MHHVKGYMIDFAPDIVLLHCGTNDFKKDLTPQKIAHNVLKLAEEGFTEVKEITWFLELLTEVMIVMLKYKR